MTLVPISEALSLIGPVIRVTCHFLALPKVLPGALASRSFAKKLVLDVRIGGKQTVAMGTSDLAVHGSTSMKTMNLSERPQDGRIRTRFKANAEEKAICTWIKEEENPSGIFLSGDPGVLPHC
jgi:hypothetical protein